MATSTPTREMLEVPLPAHLTAVRVLHTSRHAVTLEAFDERTDGRRAVKRLLPERIGEAGPHRRLLGEADALCRAQHRNIVHLHTTTECPDGSPAVVLEFVEGPNLRDVLMGGRTLPEAEVQALGSQLARALACVHKHGLVHADVKPANVMLDGDRAVLIDFHLARPPGAISSHIGTRGFTAPEVVAIEHVGKAADAWGLGAVLHRALTGTLPVPDPHWWPTAKRGHSTVDQVIHELLAPQPERRLGCTRAAALLGPL